MKDTRLIFNPKTGNLLDVKVSQEAIDAEVAALKRELEIQQQAMKTSLSDMGAVGNEKLIVRTPENKPHESFISRAISNLFLMIVIIFFLIMGIGFVITIFRTIKDLF